MGDTIPFRVNNYDSSQQVCKIVCLSISSTLVYDFNYIYRYSVHPATHSIIFILSTLLYVHWIQRCELCWNFRRHLGCSNIIHTLMISACKSRYYKCLPKCICRLYLPGIYTSFMYSTYCIYLPHVTTSCIYYIYLQHVAALHICRKYL